MVRTKLEALDRENRIEWGKSGRPYLKRYLHEQLGTSITDMILDVKPLSAQSAERIGYPTQKPLALLDRVIKASSNAGDVVLDPFCGCATACIAAQAKNREWVGIDISPKAAELVRQRMTDELGMFYQGAHRTDVPRRTDLGKLPRYSSPEEQNAALRRAGRSLRRMLYSLRSAPLRRGPHHRSCQRRNRPYRESSTSVRLVQQHQGRQRDGVLEGKARTVGE